MLEYLCAEKCRQCRLPVEWRRDGPFTLCDACDEFLCPEVTIESCREPGIEVHIGWALDYDHPPVKQMIHRMKYDGDCLISRDLARFLLPVCKMMLPSMAAPPYVVPVPLHWSRRLSRGFNQSELIAQYLCDSLGLIHANSLLRRPRKTKAHHKLDKNERATNVQNAFRAEPPPYGSSKTVLLVDDVFTSGATLFECARTLRQAGYDEIFAVTAARAY